ncbi:MAG TPA: hypothetical protein VEW05_17015 [Candidatus Polarisedimenticolia bacterium]|nr:hypothetical protein [Candidatus Polarisedimenticolia bacterium]
MSEGFYLSRVEPPRYYRAPSTIQTEAEATCKLCGEPILPNQVIADWEEEYYHCDCLEAQREDEMGDAQ